MSLSVAGQPVEFDGMTLVGPPQRTLVVMSEHEEETLRRRLVDEPSPLYWDLWVQTHLDFLRWTPTPGLTEYEWVWWDTRALPKWFGATQDDLKWPPCVFAVGHDRLPLLPLSDTVRRILCTANPGQMQTSDRPVGENGLTTVFCGWLLAMLLTWVDKVSPLTPLVEDVWSDAKEHSTLPLAHLTRLSSEIAHLDLIGQSDPGLDVITRLRQVAHEAPAAIEQIGCDPGELHFQCREMISHLANQYLGSGGLFASDVNAAAALGRAMSALEHLATPASDMF